MSAFDGLLSRLYERNVKDNEIDKIIECAENLAASNFGNKDIQEALKEVKSKAASKKNNKVIEYHDDADKFVGHTESLLNKMEKNGEKLDFAPELIASYSEIVKRYPEMIKKCNRLVGKIADNVQT